MTAAPGRTGTGRQVRRGGEGAGGTGPGQPTKDLLPWSTQPDSGSFTHPHVHFTISCLSDFNRAFTLQSQVKMLLDFVALLFLPVASLWGDNGHLWEAV